MPLVKGTIVEEVRLLLPAGSAIARATALVVKSVIALRLLKQAASLVAVGAPLAFFAVALHSSWDSVAKMISSPELLLLATGLSVAYGLSLFILFTSWFYTLRENSPVRVPARAGAYVYAVSNIAKYLPGNIFHFAGRQILGARLGWSHAAIARATLLEIAAILTSVSLIILVVGLSSGGDAAARMIFGEGSPLIRHWKEVAIALLVAGAVGFAIMRQMQLAERLFGVSARAVLVVLCLVTGFFVVYTLLAIVFVNRLPIASTATPWAMVVIAYLLAWLAGFVVPGAPGGLGVREGVLVLLLAGNAHDAGAVPVALALGLGMRFVNTLGDAFCAALAYALSRARSASFASASG